jgi:dTDP-4-dehydrorhamnose 3,5-epimerase
MPKFKNGIIFRIRHPQAINLKTFQVATRTHALGLDGLFVIEPEQNADANGRYNHYYDERVFGAAGAASHYLQEHASFYPARHTVRGLHFQRPPHAQTKVVRVARGRILDVCVDVRRTSGTYGRHRAVDSLVVTGAL